MARITVEDCLENVENRFVLVLVASKRARELAITAAEPRVSPDNDKPTVIALREIAANVLPKEGEQEEATDDADSEGSDEAVAY